MRTDGKTERERERERKTDGRTDSNRLYSFAKAGVLMQSLNQRMQRPAVNVCGVYHIVFDMRTFSSGWAMAWAL